jgi:dihydrofolate reductase
MTTVAYLAMSLDGYIADRDGGVDWLNAIPNPEGSDYGFADFMTSIDALLMGASTFRTVLSFGTWPYEKPVFVASRSMDRIPQGYEERISLVSGDIRDILGALRDAGLLRIYVDGGQLVRDCLQAGLLDEIVLCHIPVLLGGGLPLFPEQDEVIHLDHQKTEVHGVGLVKSHYLVRRGSRRA